jgi:hypothetical protein
MRHFWFVEEPNEDALLDVFKGESTRFILENKETRDLVEVIVTRFTALQHGEAGSVHFTGYCEDGSSITGVIKGEGSSGERSSVTINP